MDFYTIVVKENKDGSLTLRPDWKIGRSTDLMTRGGAFYAIWDEEIGLWSTDIYDVQRLVDADIEHARQEHEKDKPGVVIYVDRMESHNSKLWDSFHQFLRNSGNNSHNLDENVIFADTPVKKQDYASKRLDYTLRSGSHDAWDSIVGTLFNEEERAKIEWAIGAIVSGDSKIIQKFLVFYGPPGTGKSTILNIVSQLFKGYTSVFDAKALGSGNSFAGAAFKSNPLVAIQHDGDLSRIYDNTKLNSIVAHEVMPIDEKYQKVVEIRSNAFLMMGTNVPVRITDAKSGILRRLIDVVPTGQTIDHDLYHTLMDQVRFELGAIAQHCLDRYGKMGKNFYSAYRPTEMMLQTDIFYNFVEAYFDVFKEENGVTLKKAWTLYKEYCLETGIEKMLPQYKFREELKNYFYLFEERGNPNGRSYYSGFKSLDPPTPKTELPIKTVGDYQICLEEVVSIFDEMYAAMPAQLTKEDGTPRKRWVDVTTTLSDIDTSQLHYVKIPANHIVIDFDLVNESGEKDLELNLAEASKWPATYAEVSKSGHAVHLHYLYVGDVTTLASSYSPGIEIKALLGDSSLRRKLTKCNCVNITTLDGGLPKKEKPVLANRSIMSEKGLRDLIERNLRKEVHPGTKPSIDFIVKILDDAYESGMAYDVSDLRSRVLTFAARSSNQKEACIKAVQKMKFISEVSMPIPEEEDDSPIVFFDIEVYPNLFVLCWRAAGGSEVARMVNPTSKQIEPLLSKKLVGFNNRRYDNHILYARYLGFSIEELYKLSQRIIVQNDRDALFGEAYQLSYADIYDFSSVKQGLKKFQIDLGIIHSELDIPWDKPVPEELWPKVVEYCVNDVVSTEAVFNARHQDFVARQILAALSGLSVNHTTQAHTAKIIFGDEKNPQKEFCYTHLEEMFPGYEYEGKQSTYLGEVTGEGGYVYAEPGIYENVALLDVASMHPTSIEQLNLFGPYTHRYSELKEARLAIKRKDYQAASDMLDGKLAPFLGDEDNAFDLAYALKIVINIVYGLTSASFTNPFRDIRNKDNIVAKRGALFMIDLKHAVQEQGFQVVHIKTDSIKIPNATPEIIEFITDFGLLYGYDFELETVFDKFCLVNDAVYIAKDDQWHAVGAQFQHPYVFKKLFSQEPIEFADLCETKNVMQGVMYLDYSEEGDENRMVHVGRTGSFVPVLESGGSLLRVKDEKAYAVTGTKGYIWVTRETATEMEKMGDLKIDMGYFELLAENAVNAIERFGQSYGQFIN